MNRSALMKTLRIKDQLPIFWWFFNPSEKKQLKHIIYQSCDFIKIKKARLFSELLLLLLFLYSAKSHVGISRLSSELLEWSFSFENINATMKAAVDYGRTLNVPIIRCGICCSVWRKYQCAFKINRKTTMAVCHKWYYAMLCNGSSLSILTSQILLNIDCLYHLPCVYKETKYSMVGECYTMESQGKFIHQPGQLTDKTKKTLWSSSV